MSLLIPLTALFRYSLAPIAPFTWFGWGISTLDVVAAFRLCIVVRQLREATLKAHVSAKGNTPIQDTSFVKSATTTLTVVYGGEAVVAPFLGQPPSFMVSGVVPGMYAVIQAIVDNLPAVPSISAETEVPLAMLDGFTRAYLLCNLIPPAITANASPVLAASPWTLLISSLFIANGGFFMINLFSFFNPTSLAIQTPPELMPYGWTTADLWCAPVTTGLYALLTHAQPFWAELHEILAGVLGTAALGEPVKPLDPETARAVCALLLSSLFLARAGKNFGLWTDPSPRKLEPKTKTQ